MSQTRLYCTFHVGRQHYGIPVDDVQEVLLEHHVTGMPMAPAAILGLMNIRGRIVTAVSMRQVLRLENHEPAESHVNVVVHHQGSEISLVCDRIDDVVEVPAAQVERPPDTLDTTLRRFIHGVLPMPGSLLLLLDVRAVLADERCCQAPVTRRRAATAA